MRINGKCPGQKQVCIGEIHMFVIICRIFQQPAVSRIDSSAIHDAPRSDYESSKKDKKTDFHGITIQVSHLLHGIIFFMKYKPLIRTDFRTPCLHRETRTHSARDPYTFLIPHRPPCRKMQDPGLFTSGKWSFLHEKFKRVGGVGWVQIDQRVLRHNGNYEKYSGEFIGVHFFCDQNVPPDPLPEFSESHHRIHR